jgi:putative redox protein
MIEAKSEHPPLRTSFTNGSVAAVSDATADKGGTGAGFRPHELLEAALATCMNMSMRMLAQEHSIPLSEVSTTVRLDRTRPDEPCFECVVNLPDDLSESDRNRLLDISRSCAVHQTLSKKLTFNIVLRSCK